VSQLSTGWESLEGLAWSPSGKEVWFSGATSGERYCIRAVNLGGKLRTLYCGTASTLIHDTDASGRMLVSSEEHRVAIGYVEHGSAEVRDISWLNGSTLPHLSHDGSEILFTDTSESSGSGYSIYTRKSDGSPAVRIGEGGVGTDISPDGKWALVLLPGDPAERVQIVPAGAGQTRVLHWEGIAPIWATWFPDGQHILLATKESGPANLYETDVSGSTPKLLMSVTGSPALVSPDGRFILAGEDDGWKLRSIAENTVKPVAAFQSTETPLAWTLDMNHIFTQMPQPSGLMIYKHDLESGHAELWQAIKLKDQAGLRQAANGGALSFVSITPDGRWMAFNFATELGQLYASNPIK
jgi:Tol biopolymer transport system component